MTRRALVSDAQAKRALRVLEGSGKTVSEVYVLPDGSWRFRLTTGGETTLPSTESAEAGWDEALGLQ